MRTRTSERVSRDEIEAGMVVLHTDPKAPAMIGNSSLGSVEESYVSRGRYMDTSFLLDTKRMASTFGVARSWS